VGIPAHESPGTFSRVMPAPVPRQAKKNSRKLQKEEKEWQKNP
jgi:hypothetical protein